MYLLHFTVSIVLHAFSFMLGSYMYIETSSPVQTGWTARLLSPVLQGGSEKCMKFAHHMYGASMGKFMNYLYSSYIPRFHAKPAHFNFLEKIRTGFRFRLKSLS